jgi:hypothetical protein
MVQFVLFVHTTFKWNKKKRNVLEYLYYSSLLNDNITVTLYSVERGPEKKIKDTYKKNKEREREWEPNECAFSLYK